MNKIMLIDSSNLAHKAHYKKDKDSVEEFFSIVNKLKRCFKPEKVIFSLDSEFLTWRHVAFEGYKAHRPPKTEEFKAFKTFLENKIKEEELHLFREGYESDDLIGSYVTQRKAYEDILIITQDLDHSQLLDKNVLQLKFCEEFGLEHVTKEYIQYRFGIDSQYIPDLKAISGDSSDNIKGLWRIGDKKAAIYINKYGGLESILESLKQIPIADRTALDQQFIDNEKTLLLNLRLTRLVTDLNLNDN